MRAENRMRRLGITFLAIALFVAVPTFVGWLWAYAAKAVPQPPLAIMFVTGFFILLGLAVAFALCSGLLIALYGGFD